MADEGDKPESSNRQTQIRENYTTIPLQCPTLTTSNYTIWAVKLKAIFNVHGLWEVVEPKEGAEVDVKKNNAAIAYLYQAMPEDLVLQVANLTTAKSIWDSLKARFVGIDRVKKARLATLKNEFEMLKMKDSENIDEFAGRITAIASKAVDLGEAFTETALVRKFLDSVPDRFLHIIASIEQFVDLETMLLQEAIGRLKAFEERTCMKKQSPVVKEDQLLMTYSEWQAKKKNAEFKTRKWGSKSDKMNRFEKGQKSKEEKGKTQRFKKDKSKIKCFKCNVYGHFASECPENKTFDQEANFMQKDPDEPALLMTEKITGMVFLNEHKVIPSNYDSNEVEDQVWYLDNGASNHMTGNSNVFSVIDKSIKGRVRFGDDSCVEIEGKGSIILEGKTGEHRLLTDVYYIPHLRSNIFSLGQATEGGCEVKMKGENLWLYEASGRLLLKSTRSLNRLYKVVLRVGSPMCFQTKLDMESTPWIWHGRLGHVNFDSIRNMVMKQMVIGVPEFKNPTQLCVACLAGKHTSSPFPNESSYRSEYPLQMISVDLCGPISPSTPAGNRYFMLLVDDCTRYMWVYMLKNKDQAFDIFKEFKMNVENEFGFKIKALRSDRGGEFTSAEFNKFCSQQGIVRMLTAPYSPQQNGAVERRNRTILNMVRSLLKAMKMPQQLWAEAVRHSVYLLNRMYTKALNNCTPYEALKGRKPNLSHVRVFGCVGHVKTPKERLKKLDDRSTPMVYLGNEPGTKAHRMFNVQGRTIVTSRNVKFEENKKWDWSNSLNTSQGDNDLTASSMEEFCIIDDQDQDTQQPHKSQTESVSDQPESSQSIDTGGRTEDSEPVNGNNTNLRRSTRTPAVPPKLSDFVLDGRVKYGQNRQEDEDNIDLMLTQDDVPKTYEEAATGQGWRMAMDSEIQSIEKNKVWVLTDPPEGCNPIGLKWLYKIKRDAKGEVVRYKARLVAKGYVQQLGVDFDDGFAPVARMETIRLILSLSAKMNWKVFHLDVKTAFLNGELKETVFVKQPDGYVKPGLEMKVYRLEKALYGLRQAPRAWNHKLNSVLMQLKFRRCELEQSVYTRVTNNKMIVLCVYVDDLLLTGNDLSEIDHFKQQMTQNFEMADMGLLCYYLGIEVSQSEDGIAIKQSAYAKKILELAGLKECNEVKIPMEPGLKLLTNEGGNEVDPTMFRKLVGSLRYLTYTRPDISYAVGYVSRFMQQPREAHLKAVKHIIRYVKGTVQFGIKYKTQIGGKLLGFSDSNYSTDSEDGRSTSGNVFYYNDGLVSWQSQKQPTVALSSCEAEFMAATAAACQAIWLHGLLVEITGKDQEIVSLFVDNKSAILLMKNPVFHGKSKHISPKYHFIRQCVERNQVLVDYVSGKMQRADVLTKALPRVKFEEMRKLLGVEDVKN
ncbi:hypothetical protein QVD17_40194 [Tagetes erecta]|uniref:Uncharacterized protein n=1 Tax=Tagetes erecta TaxID=13708 RepID=A0AAD8JR85_TARER|nr:hypothetical protein QVD17_40194 [Tagetes erecta]